MNKLPKDRSTLYGRTYSRSYNPSDYDPIERPESRSGEHVVDWILLCMLILLLIYFVFLEVGQV
jgi:hypothetical protein